MHTHTLPFPRALGLIAAFDSFTVERSIHASDKRELFFFYLPRLFGLIVQLAHLKI